MLSRHFPVSCSFVFFFMLYIIFYSTASCRDCKHTAVVGCRWKQLKTQTQNVLFVHVDIATDNGLCNFIVTLHYAQEVTNESPGRRKHHQSTHHSIGHDVVPVKFSAIVLLLVKLLTFWNEILQLQMLP